MRGYFVTFIGLFCNRNVRKVLGMESYELREAINETLARVQRVREWL